MQIIDRAGELGAIQGSSRSTCIAKGSSVEKMPVFDVFHAFEDCIENKNHDDMRTVQRSTKMSKVLFRFSNGTGKPGGGS